MMPKRPSPQKRACDACHRRKIQCSFSSTSTHDPCDWCTHRRIECTFNRERPKKKSCGSASQNEADNLSQRIEQLENALAQASSSQNSTQRNLSSTEELVTPSPSTARERIAVSESHADESASIPIQAPGEIHESSITEPQHEVTRSANQLGPNWFFNGMAICSEAGCKWMSTRTNQNVSLDDFSFPDIEATSPDVRSCRQSGFVELPLECDAREILNVYFRSPFRLAFPILDQDLLEKTIQTAYNSTGKSMPSTVHNPAKACILAAVAIISGLDTSKQSSASVDATLGALEAHSILMQTTSDPSLENLQTILFLQLSHMFNGHWQNAAVWNSMACSTICSLGGHVHRQTTASEPELHRERETRHTRMLFWLSYILDKDIALHTGNPPLLTDAYCDLSPHQDHTNYYEHPPRSQNFEQLMPYLPGDFHLSRLKEKVYRKLFSAPALKNDNNQLLLNIRQLDDEIERWRLSVPVNLRPALSVSRGSPFNTLGEGDPHFIRLVSLQLEYHHLMTVIHTTVRKCTPDAGGYRDLHDVVHSSFDLSLEASRSSIWCIKSLSSQVTEESTRLIVSYLATAAMSLFLNTVIHPLDPPAQLDLEVLISGANAVRNSCTHELAQASRLRLQKTSDFVMRLVWLGTCAVTKAIREKRPQCSQLAV